MDLKAKVMSGCVAAALLVLSTTAGPAMAQDRNRAFGFHGFGPRVGMSITPDQVFVGGHVDFGEAWPHVRFQPNLEIGFGDHETTVQADADFHYRFLESWDVWNPYLGGGLGVEFVSLDTPDNAPEGFDDSATKLQAHVTGGIEKYINPGKFFIESKLGITDWSPDLKILAGWTFVR